MRTLFLLLILGSVLQAQSPRGLVSPEKRGVQPRDASADTTESSGNNTQAAVTESLLGNSSGSETVVVPSADGTSFRYFGHAFVYLTSSSGVRLAINPFSADAGLGYKFPRSLPADVVLISTESPEYSGGQDLFGLPQVFRSLTGIGANRANGVPFRGIGTYRDAQEGRQHGGNTVYLVELDGLRFCHLGGIGHVPTRSQAREIGPVDVLFLPVGNLDLSVPDLWKTADLLQARWVVPVAYKTEKSGALSLRPLGDFDFHQHPVKEVAATEFTFRQSELPATPTVLIVKSP